MTLTSEASGSNSAVECQLPKLDVAGSIPVSRSIQEQIPQGLSVPVESRCEACCSLVAPRLNVFSIAEHHRLRRHYRTWRSEGIKLSYRQTKSQTVPKRRITEPDPALQGSIVGLRTYRPESSPMQGTVLDTMRQQSERCFGTLSQPCRNTLLGTRVLPLTAVCSIMFAR